MLIRQSCALMLLLGCGRLGFEVPDGRSLVTDGSDAPSNGSLPTVVNSSYIGSTSGASVMAPRPPGTLAGHLMIAHATIEVGGIYGDPGGWTVVDRMTSGSADQQIYSKIATSNEPTAYNWPLSGGSNGRSVGIVTLAGASGVETWSRRGGNTTGSQATASGVSTAGANRMLLAFFTVYNGSSFSSASMIELWDNLPDPDYSLSAYVAPFATAGMTGDISVSAGVNGSNQAAHLLAISP